MFMSEVATTTVKDLIKHGLLRVVFQPIAALADGNVPAHEALIRGPVGSGFEFPDTIFFAADREHMRSALELECIRVALERVRSAAIPGRIFLNLSGMVLVSIARAWGLPELTLWFERCGVPLSKLVIEITEHDRIDDIDYLKSITDALRAKGVLFALDDFGDGRSSLRLWAEIQPTYVKIDKFFTKDIERVNYKAQTLKALGHISEILGGTLIAEGIENELQLSIVRDLGISLGQGYFIGRPASEPLCVAAPSALDAIARQEVAVLTESATASSKDISAERLIIAAQPVTLDACNDEVLQIFQSNAELHALAVVAEQRPVGLINRRVFMDRLTLPFQRELLGKRQCSLFMDKTPRLVERSSGVSDMINLLTSDDQRYLSEGFIIVDNGIYIGLGTGEQLVRMVTEHRLEAARHANPLTFLPGNIPISQHIEKLLRNKKHFHAAYCDLNHFKPFNDQYGYWRGDEMIRLLSGVVLTGVDSRLDFIGHVGGDDFVVIFQSEDWLERCHTIVRTFNERARGLFDAEAIERGGIEAEDRNGQPAFFPLTTLAVGVVNINPARFRRAEHVASAAAVAKRQAKRFKVGVWFESSGHDGEDIASNGDSGLELTLA
jgi:diguanylate cyclase (GGDEF)-like protein